MVRLGSTRLVNFWLVWAVIVLCWLAAPESAQATVCSQRDRQEVCLGSLQRSAKNYWEYRVRLKVDGRLQSPVIYDCRAGKKSWIAGVWMDLVVDAVDITACSLYHH
jgi:hypothetical protein